MEEIEFTLHPDGQVEYTVKGVKGTGCEQLTELFSQLGKTAISKPTSEYYEVPPEINAKQITGRG